MMEVQRFSLEEFNVISKQVHLNCFNEIREEEVNTFDFALMAIHKGEPVAYATCIEFDKDTCYMQHGGSLPGGHGTINTARGYVKMLMFIKEKYPMITTRIQNTNVRMLKLALGAGFIPIGIDCHNADEIYLHMMNKGSN